MLSFYGGQPGKDFRVSKIFNSRVELEEDLKQRWYSNIGVGEMVFISYGLANDADTSEIEVTSENMPYIINDVTEVFWGEYETDIFPTEREYVVAIEEFLNGYTQDESSFMAEGKTSCWMITAKYGVRPRYYFFKSNEKWFHTDAIYTQNESVYKINREKDINKYNGKTFNGSLWMKIYLDENFNLVDMDGTIQYPSLSPLAHDNNLVVKLSDVEDIQGIGDNTYGLAYVLIASFQGEMPVISVQGSRVLNADEDPKVSVDLNDTVNPKINFSLPQSQNINVKDSFTATLNADQAPKLYIYDGYNARAVFEERAKDNGDGTDDIGNGLQVGLTSNGSISVKDKNGNEFGNSEKANINAPILEIDIPQAQILAKPNYVQLPPDYEEGPFIDIDDEGEKINSPELTFNVPRAARYIFGQKISPTVDTDGELTGLNILLNASSNIEEEIELYDLVYIRATGELRDIKDRLCNGDWYVNVNNGYIFKVQADDGVNVAANDYNFIPAGRLISPSPELLRIEEDKFDANLDMDGLKLLHPYEDETGKLQQPLLDKVYLDDLGLQERIYFSIPKLPEITTTYTEVGSTENGFVEQTYPTLDSTSFDFTIPRGVRFFQGEDVNDSDNGQIFQVEGAKPGDVYLNELTGYLYQWNGINWDKGANLTGPTGTVEQIGVANAVYQSGKTKEQILEAAALSGRPIDPNNPTQQRFPEPGEYISVNYTDENGNINTIWMFYLDGKWNPNYITGGTGGLIINEHRPTEQNSAYSANYINTKVISSSPDFKDYQTYNAKTIDQKTPEVKTQEQLDSLDENAIQDGKIYVASDTGNMYVGVMGALQIVTKNAIAPYYRHASIPKDDWDEEEYVYTSDLNGVESDLVTPPIVYCRSGFKTYREISSVVCGDNGNNITLTFNLKENKIPLEDMELEIIFFM